ncbi:MAG: response regulator transcription factor [Chloroflexota bacterium]|nr:response regulator transcription factor [Chloroflexota bacterium]
MKILVVDDEPDVIEVVRLCFNLRWPEAEVLAAATGEEALAAVESQSPDLVLLDIMLPGMDGFEVCQEVRRFSDVPIIMLTARDAEVERVRGLEMGADDYITKPFSHLELLARSRAVLRRYQNQPPAVGEMFEAGNLQVDYASRRVIVGGKPVKLTPIEYGLLYHLTRNAGRVLPHRTLLAKVWGREYENELDYLKVYVRRLRHKLEEDPGAEVCIESERGVGYRLVPANSQS